ncbi:MAG: PHP domain-containing protein, partial [Pedobacter sp.]
MSYCELQITSNFSFLRGASHPEEMVQQAATFGYPKIAITDVNTLAGIVRAHSEARKHNIKLIPACRLDLLDGNSLLAYPTNREAYGRLSALLSLGNLRAEKGKCHLYKTDVFAHKEGIIFIAIAPDALSKGFNFEATFPAELKLYKEEFGHLLYLAANRNYQGQDQKRMYRLATLAKSLNIPLVATNDVYYHHLQRRELQDVLTCVREKCTIQNAGFLLHQNAERHLKPIEEMERLFRQYPEAIEKTMEIAELCQFSLDSLEYIYPEEITSEGRTPQEELEYLSWKGAREIFGEPLPKKVVDNINHEMAFVKEMKYASYFLTVYDIVRFAREQKILCQGRGSAANSTICYCLG